MERLAEALGKHLRSPHGGGGAWPEDAAAGRGENAVCGDRVEIGLSVAAGRVERAVFRAQGCSATLAVASVACEGLEGRPLGAFTSRELAAGVEALGGLPPNRRHAMEVVSRALDAALALARQHCHPET